VAAIVVDFYSQGRVVQGSWNDLRRYFGVNDATYFFVKLEPGEPVTLGQERIEEVYGLRFHLTVENNQELRDQAMRLAAQVFGLFDVLALVAIAVAAFGVVNTLTMSVTERTREIGALRGLGMKRSQVMRMILAEAGLMGVIGTSLGLVFGLFLSRVFLLAVTETRGYDLAYVFPVGGMVVSLLITIILSQLAAIWPARRAARMRIVEAIQYE
jgi:putative ABC transport system permease protein